MEGYFAHRDELLPGRLDGAFLLIIPCVRFRIKGNRAPCLGDQRELGPEGGGFQLDDEEKERHVRTVMLVPIAAR